MGYYRINASLTRLFEGIQPFSWIVSQDCWQESLKNCWKLFVTMAGHLNREVQVYRGVKLLNLSFCPWTIPENCSPWTEFIGAIIVVKHHYSTHAEKSLPDNMKECLMTHVWLNLLNSEVLLWLAKTVDGAGVSISGGAVNHHSVCLR